MQKNVDDQEIAKFAGLAAHWWDPAGDLKTLHHINPLRLAYIKQKVALSGLKVIDIGCGGGILSESLAVEGAAVTGIDLNQRLIQVAKLHLLESGLKVDYQVISAEDMAATYPHSFDVVTCLELLEHVPNPKAIIEAAVKLLKPGGHLFFSTINRHPKAYLFAILGAEYLLKLLPKNTHDYAKFIRPGELCTWLREAHATPAEIKGMSYQPFTHAARLTDDLSVNYLVYARC